MYRIKVHDTRGVVVVQVGQGYDDGGVRGGGWLLGGLVGGILELVWNRRGLS